MNTTVKPNKVGAIKMRKIIRFTAEWCQPCKMLSKQLETMDLNLPIDVIDIANAYNLSFMKGNAIKYILRAGKKDLLVQDLKKAIECLNREIEYEGGK